MASYKDIQEFVSTMAGYRPLDCWIADVKEEYHLTSRRSPNRRPDGVRANKCPDDKRADIVAAFKHFGML